MGLELAGPGLELEGPGLGLVGLELVEGLGVGVHVGVHVGGGPVDLVGGELEELEHDWLGLGPVGPVGLGPVEGLVGELGVADHVVPVGGEPVGGEPEAGYVGGRQVWFQGGPFLG